MEKIAPLDWSVLISPSKKNYPVSEEIIKLIDTSIDNTLQLAQSRLHEKDIAGELINPLELEKLRQTYPYLKPIKLEGDKIRLDLKFLGKGNDRYFPIVEDSNSFSGCEYAVEAILEQLNNKE